MSFSPFPSRSPKGLSFDTVPRYTIINNNAGVRI
jgi:hypothetical protein